jgi:hypothetical protein
MLCPGLGSLKCLQVFQMLEAVILSGVSTITKDFGEVRLSPE